MLECAVTQPVADTASGDESALEHGGEKTKRVYAFIFYFFANEGLKGKASLSSTCFQNIQCT